jgi:2-dehydropantoate 2-reductase
VKICVYGVGAVGGLMAAWLSRGGKNEVSAVARGTQLEALRKDGLRIRDRASGKMTTFSIVASDDPAVLGPQDYVIVAVKAQNLTEVASGIRPLLGPDTSIVTAMNGVPWWFFDCLKYGGGSQRLESLATAPCRAPCRRSASSAVSSTSPARRPSPGSSATTWERS